MSRAPASQAGSWADNRRGDRRHARDDRKQAEVRLAARRAPCQCGEERQDGERLGGQAHAETQSFEVVRQPDQCQHHRCRQRQPSLPTRQRTPPAARVAGRSGRRGRCRRRRPAAWEPGATSAGWAGPAGPGPTRGESAGTPAGRTPATQRERRGDRRGERAGVTGRQGSQVRSDMVKEGVAARDLRQCAVGRAGPLNILFDYAPGDRACGRRPAPLERKSDKHDSSNGRSGLHRLELRARLAAAVPRRRSSMSTS